MLYCVHFSAKGLPFPAKAKAVTRLEALREVLLAYGLAAKDVRAADADGDVWIVDGSDGGRWLVKRIGDAGGEDYDGPENVFHTRAQLALEMELLRRIRAFGLGTAEPLQNLAGGYVTSAPGDAPRLSTVVRYVEAPVMESLRENRSAMAYASGVAAARLHDASAAALRTLAPERPHHREDYLARVQARIHASARRTGSPGAAVLRLFDEGFDRIRDCMARLDADPLRNLGMVHTDLRCGNLLYDGEKAIPIDFTRAVYGHYLYDLGEMCAHMGGMCPDARAQILAGYRSVRRFRPGEIRMVQCFFVMFLFSVFAELGFAENTAWAANTARELAEVYIPALSKDGFFGGIERELENEG